MLQDFLIRERETILIAAKQQARESQGARMTSELMQSGWGIFYDELVTLLDRDYGFEFEAQKGFHTQAAKNRGKEYLRLGYTVSEVVYSYGIICQAITSLATKLGVEVTPREFQKLNLSLDIAIAEAVSEFERVRRKSFDLSEARRLGFLAHELRTYLESATIALDMVQSGSVGIQSSTSRTLQSSLNKMGDVIDKALTEVRLREEPEPHLLRIRVFELMNEVGVTSGFEARERGIVLKVQGFSDLEVEVDRQLLVSALANLVQNAIKFSKPDGTVSIRAHEKDNRVLIDVDDECGGLPEGRIEELLSDDTRDEDTHKEEGYGLAIAKQAIEKNNGVLRGKNIPNKGCVFTIDLPKPQEIYSS